MWKVSLVLLLFCQTFYAQSKDGFGILSHKEKAFQEYAKDSTVPAVFLYEHGNNYFEVRNNYVWLITTYHAKIKILNSEGFEYATVGIPFYHNDSGTEEVKKVRAITHNNGVKNVLPKNNIYVVDRSERWKEKRFTFSNVKVGSILEYTYEIQSPFYFNLNGWEFQSDIPKLHTEYSASIPGNWRYNRTLSGNLKLFINEATIKKDCFSIPISTEMADCEVVRYVMKDVPALPEREEFMLAEKNYRPVLEFELATHLNFKGFTRKYTKSWEDVDIEFRSDKDLGRQLRKKNFFEKNVPLELLGKGDLMSRAKTIYAFVQNHFTWNEKYGIWYDNRVKKAFEERKGNVAEINIALINLLNAAGIKTNMMLMATRQFGLPKQNHPVMSDFNYVIARVQIEDQQYLLDATDKLLPFGMLPFRCLNYYGRVMDFDKGSYWQKIIPNKKNGRTTRAEVSLDPEEGNAIGTMITVSTGYACLNKRRQLNTIDRDSYLEKMSEEFGGDFNISSYELVEKFSNEKRITEKYAFEIENTFQAGNIYLDPFFFKFFRKNPFLASKRHYPIDFGYQRNSTFNLSIKTPPGYKLKSLPESKNMALPEDLGSLRFECKKETAEVISVYFDFKINATQFHKEAYDVIRTFFQHAVDTQTQSYIVFEKV
ncbi:MAG: DUF3857 and transglutaminase domain-containing protein [Bacteroidota bacterium]